MRVGTLPRQIRLGNDCEDRSTARPGRWLAIVGWSQYHFACALSLVMEMAIPVVMMFTSGNKTVRMPYMVGSTAAVRSGEFNPSGRMQ